MLTGKALRSYLAYAIHGKKDPSVFKKPPQLARSPIPPKRKGPPRRTNCLRDEAYKAWIRTQPSIVSGLHGCEAAHTGTDGGQSLKASDDTCVPLTPAEHREYHAIGKQSFARRHGVSFGRACARLRILYARAK
jgi:hypothetical protein